jgi:hypothetical protein
MKVWSLFWTCKMFSGILFGTREFYHCWLFQACITIVHCKSERTAKWFEHLLQTQIPSWHNIWPNCNLYDMWDVIHLIPTVCILWNMLLSAWDIRQCILAVVYWKFYWFVFVLSIAYRALMMHYTLSICIHTWWVNDDYCTICFIPTSKCRKLNWNVQRDVGHYANFLGHLLVTSLVKTGLLTPLWETLLYLQRIRWYICN